VAAVAFDPGPVQDAAKMGALFSFAAAIVSIIAGKVTHVQKQYL
jgi:NhaA family Na+:H+ antiporter